MTTEMKVKNLSPRAMARMLEPGTGTCGQIDRPPPEPPPEPHQIPHHAWSTFQQTGQTMPKPHEGATPLQRMHAHSEKLEPQLPAQAMRWGSRAGFIQSPREIGQECRAGGAALKYRTHGNHAVTAIVGPAAHPRNAPTETRSSIILSNYNGSLFFSSVNLPGTSIYYGACSHARSVFSPGTSEILRRLLTSIHTHTHIHTHIHTHTAHSYIGIFLPRDLSFHMDIPRKEGYR